jgi:hypothetical protein
MTMGRAKRRPKNGSPIGFQSLVQLEKITDYAIIASADILATLGIALDGRLISSGKIPSTIKVESWLA